MCSFLSPQWLMALCVAMVAALLWHPLIEAHTHVVLCLRCAAMFTPSRKTRCLAFGTACFTRAPWLCFELRSPSSAFLHP